MLHVVVSPSGAERLAAARAFVQDFPPATEILLVGASREAVDDLVREIAGATFGLHRASLIQLAARLAAPELARRGLAPGSVLGAEAVAARATFEVLARDGLGYFAPVARCPGFGRALASTVNDLRLEGVAPSRVAGLGEAGADLAVLAREFEAQLARAAVADRATLLDVAARGAVPAFPLILLDVPVHSAAERALVAALLAAAPRALVTIPTGDDRTLAAIDQIGAESTEERRPPVASYRPRASGAALDRLRAYLFSEDRPPEADGSSGDVLFFSAPGEHRECVEIARRIRDEARAGVAFDQIAVLLRAPEVYGGLLETALRRAGIPAHFARGTRRPDPSGRAFLALLACAAEGLSARRFAEYLSLGQVPSLDASGAPPSAPAEWQRPDDEGLGLAADDPTEDTLPPIQDARHALPPIQDDEPVVAGTLRAPWNWERLLVEAAVIGGTDRWRRRLDGLAAEYRLKRDEIASEEPESPRIAGLERDLDNLGHLRRFALPIIDVLAGFPRDAAWGEWLDVLERLAPMVLRIPDRVLAVLADLRPMSTVGPASLEEVRQVLADRLATVRERPAARRYGHVFVGSPEQVRGRSFRVVFAPGLSERVFPRKPREDPLLLDALRRDIAPGLPTREDHGRHERQLLRLAAGAARERLTLSYSRVEVAEGRPRVPSFYALEVSRATTGRLRDFQEMERDAALQGGARLVWPAPDDPADAIDAIEHDLSVLGALLRSGDARDRGRASYLLQLSPSLRRSLRSQWWRSKRRAWAPFDGLVRATDRTREALASHRLGARPYSVSALQKFAACPYQFFLSAIFRLEPREEAAPLQQLDPLTRGKIFHQVQAEVLRELRAGGHLPLASVDVARPVLEEVLHRVAQECEEQLAPAIARVWERDLETLAADLRGWLHRLAEAGTEWEGIFFEFAFGFAPTRELDPASQREPVRLPGGQLLHGVIDVVERRTGGDDLRVTDHKTGVNRTRNGMVVGAGETLQPVLYSLALEEALGRRVTEARLFYCTPVGGFAERIVPMTDAARGMGREVLQIIDRAIENGFLPPAPRERACGWCDFRSICGPWAERRAARKDTVPLGDLQALRKLP